MHDDVNAQTPGHRNDIASPYQGTAGDRYAKPFEAVNEVSPTINHSNFSGYVSPHSTVVDFGCGDGGVLANLDVAFRIGVEATDVGRKAALERGLNRVVQSLDQLDDETADVVISNHALEHTLNPARELSEMLRVLRPDGTLVLWLPLDDWRTQRRPDPNDPNHHFYTWTPLLLANLLSEVGFHVRYCRIINRAFPPKVHVLVRLLGRDRVTRLAGSTPFEFACALSARITRRRQLKAVAVRPGVA